MAGTGMAVSGALGLGEAVVGFINAGKAKKEAAELKASRPKLKASPFLKDQLSLAESDLSTGMSAEAKQGYEEGMDRDLSTSLGTITRMGGSANDVGSVFANNAIGRSRLAMMKDNLRLSQINNVVRAQDANEEERQKEFQFNEWAPWADAAQANAVAKSTAQSEIFGGLNTAAGGAMRFGEDQQQKQMFDKYFSKTPPTAGAASKPSTSFLDGLLGTVDTGV